MIDDLLLLEIVNLRQKLYLAAKDINKLDGSNINDYLHDLATRDYFEEIKEDEDEDRSSEESQ